MFVSHLNERFVEHGFDVTVLTTDCFSVNGFWDASLPRIPIEPNEVRNGVKVKRFPVRTRWSPALRQVQRVAYRLRLPGNDWLRTWYHGPICPGMLQATGTFDADVICAASFPLNHMLYPFRRREPRPPVILMPSSHTADSWGFERQNILGLVNRAYATVANTEHERDWLLDHGAHAGRLRVIGHGIEPGELAPVAGAFRARHGIDAGGFLVAYFGQHGRHKGIDVMLRAFPALLDRCPDAWLAIGGSRTPFTPELERIVADLPAHARERCRLLSDLGHQDKADLLGDCDVFASPSAAESFGITTIEAWSLRKPVVVGDSPSQHSVVDDGVSGVIVPHGDEGRLVDVLARLGGDVQLRERMGAAGHATLLAKYRRSDVENRWADLIREAAHAATQPQESGLRAGLPSSPARSEA
jgi:glycosyltransferase involved in cell wall biosynthesis